MFWAAFGQTKLMLLECYILYIVCIYVCQTGFNNDLLIKNKLFWQNELNAFGNYGLTEDFWESMYITNFLNTSGLALLLWQWMILSLSIRPMVWRQVIACYIKYKDSI